MAPNRVTPARLRHSRQTMAMRRPIGCQRPGSITAARPSSIVARLPKVIQERLLLLGVISLARRRREVNASDRSSTGARGVGEPAAALTSPGRDQGEPEVPAREGLGDVDLAATAIV